ncbi:MAG: hypothetical protein IJX84_02695 [Clostridia bacterium]|nr:hypothetical protein [Clostridia bacterium]
MASIIVLIALLVAGVLLTAWAALTLIQRRWQHPWHLSQPLFSLRQVTIEGELLLTPRHMTAAHLPFEATQQPRVQSGGLLWASAITVTHTLADEADRAALLAAVKPLGFTPEKFLARCPILGEVQHSGLRGYIVRDGSGQRAYFLAAPHALLEACAHVWEQQERPKTPQDISRLPAASPGLYGLAMATVEQGSIGALTYLGSVQVGMSQCDLSPLDILRAHGLTLHILPNDGDVPASALHIGRQPSGANSFAVPEAHGCGFVQDILAGYQQEQKLLRKAIPALVWSLLWQVAIHLFTHYAIGSAAPAALWVMLFTHAAALMLPLFTSKKLALLALPVLAILWLVAQPTALSGAFCLVAGLTQAFVTRLLLAALECS